MQSLPYIKILFVALNTAAFAAFAYYCMQLQRVKPKDLPWRGLVKLVSLGTVSDEFARCYRLWFIAFAGFFLITCITVSIFVWATDHSFFVVLFPLLFYYFFARYLLWEKQDLAD